MSLKVDIITPEEYMGDVIGDINARRGSIVELTDRNGLKQVESTVPLANMFQVSRGRFIDQGYIRKVMPLQQWWSLYSIVPVPYAQANFTGTIYIYTAATDTITLPLC